MKLTREQVVRTALRLLDEVGLEGLTLRRIAAELGVQAPALYWHVANKKQLLDELATTIMEDAVAALPADGEPPGDWREGMVGAADFLRGMLLSHRDGARVVSGTYVTRPALTPERVLPMLHRAGMSTAAATTLVMTVYHYTVGFVIEEQEVYPRPGQRDPRYERAALRDASPRRDPEVLAAQFTDPPQDRFRAGVRLIVDGAAP